MTYAIAPAALVKDKKLTAQQVRTYMFITLNLRHDGTCSQPLTSLAQDFGVAYDIFLSDVANLISRKYMAAGKTERGEMIIVPLMQCRFEPIELPAREAFKKEGNGTKSEEMEKRVDWVIGKCSEVWGKKFRTSRETGAIGSKPARSAIAARLKKGATGDECVVVIHWAKQSWSPKFWNPENVFRPKNFDTLLNDGLNHVAKVKYTGTYKNAVRITFDGKTVDVPDGVRGEFYASYLRITSKDTK